MGKEKGNEEEKNELKARGTALKLSWNAEDKGNKNFFVTMW